VASASAAPSSEAAAGISIDVVIEMPAGWASREAL
jgi:hypothetical protein